MVGRKHDFKIIEIAAAKRNGTRSGERQCNKMDTRLCKDWTIR